MRGAQPSHLISHPFRGERDERLRGSERAITMSDQLRHLARRVERLAVSGRTDPEMVVMEKQLIGRALRRLAAEAGQ